MYKPQTFFVGGCNLIKQKNNWTFSSYYMLQSLFLPLFFTTTNLVSQISDIFTKLYRTLSKWKLLFTKCYSSFSGLMDSLRESLVVVYCCHFLNNSDSFSRHCYLLTCCHQKCLCYLILCTSVCVVECWDNYPSVPPAHDDQFHLVWL